MKVQPSEVNGGRSSTIDSQATSQVQCNNSPLSSRAREILDSLKEQRESLLGRWNDGGDKTSPRMRSNASSALVATSLPPFIRSSAIQKLQATLHQERLSRLRKQQRFLPVSPGTTSSGSCSVDGSDAGKGSVGTRSTETEETLSCTTFSSPVSPTTQSVDDAVLLNKSIHIPNPTSGASMRNGTTASMIPVSTPSSSTYQGQRNNALDCSAPEISHSKAESCEIPSLGASMHGDLSKDTTATASASAVEDSAGSDGDSDPAINEPRSPQPSSPRKGSAMKNELQRPLPPDPIPSDGEPVLLGTEAMPTMDPVEETHGFSSIPVTPSRAPNFDATSNPTSNRQARNMTLGDVEIPLELSPIDRRCKQRLSSNRVRVPSSADEVSTPQNTDSPKLCPGSACSAPTSTSMSLRSTAERKAYIGQLYQNQGSFATISRRKPRSTAMRSSSGLRRREPNHVVNRVLVRGRVAILKPSNLRVFVPESEKGAIPGDGSATKRGVQSEKSGQSPCQIDFTTQKPENKEATSTGVSIREKDSQISAFANSSDANVSSVSALQRTANSLESRLGGQPRSCDDTSLDETVTTKRRERLALIRHLEEDVAKSTTANNPSSLSTKSSCVSSRTSTSSGSIVISDDSSCDLTTSSESSDWASSLGESTNLLASDSIADTYSIVSCVTMPPLSPLSPPAGPIKKAGSARRQVVVAWKEPLLSEMRSPSFDEESQQPQSVSSKPTLANALTSSSNLFVAGRAADSLCFAYGGHFMIATKSGMTLHHHTKLKLTRLDQKPTTMKKVCLSTDLRCGTRGSLYDIAVRSGCNTRDPYLSNRAQRRATSVDTNTAPRDSSSNAGRSRKTEDLTAGTLANTLQRMPFAVATNRVKLCSKNCLIVPGPHCSPGRSTCQPSIQEPHFCVVD
jgi:hypothetical protein